MFYLSHVLWKKSYHAMEKLSCFFLSYSLVKVVIHISATKFFNKTTYHLSTSLNSAYEVLIGVLK